MIQQLSLHHFIWIELGHYLALKNIGKLAYYINNQVHVDLSASWICIFACFWFDLFKNLIIWWIHRNLQYHSWRHCHQTLKCNFKSQYKTCNICFIARTLCCKMSSKPWGFTALSPEADFFHLHNGLTCISGWVLHTVTLRNFLGLMWLRKPCQLPPVHFSILCRVLNIFNSKQTDF